MKRNKPIAKKSDWNTAEMPMKQATFSLHRSFGAEELAALRVGYIPEGMDDKWFWYMEENTLYAHRSWTGYCIYILQIVPNGDVHEVRVNRDPKQYMRTDINEEINRLNKLLNWWTRSDYQYMHKWAEEIQKTERSRLPSRKS